jgi:ribonucleotide monophosphatase NagD (HAD superfamily)
LCAGSLAVRYQELGGDVRSLGKPDPAIYRPVLEQLDIPKARVLAVGDSLHTDIAGAASVGLAACWVLDGLHGSALRQADGSYDPRQVEAAARDRGLAPVAAITKFEW